MVVISEALQIFSPYTESISSVRRGRTRRSVYDKKLSYRRETARQLYTSFSAHSLTVHFTEHRICFYSASA